jgi:hypothetical protein
MPNSTALPRRVRARRFLAASLATLFTATSAHAGIVPLANQSQVYAKAVAGATVDSDLQTASGTGLWDGLALAEADNGAGTVSACDALLEVEMTSGCLYGAGKGRGIGGGPAPFQHETAANLSLLFIVNQTQDYTADLGITVGPGTLPGQPGALAIALYDVNMGTAAYWRHTSGSTLIEGRIAPGAYKLWGHYDYLPTAQGGESGDIFANVCFTTSTNPLITAQPQDQTVTPGVTIDMQVTVTPNAARELVAGEALVTTYQWRRNLQNLTNGGRISGVNTNHLAITAAVAADTGRYDCVVTQGSIVEPSRLARIALSGAVGVELPLTAADVQLRAPVPNPFVAATRFEFTLGRGAPVSLTVYDALGRQVKEVLPLTSLPAGRYGIDWNGTDRSGTRVKSGVYFVHLTSGATRLVQRAILVTGGR